MTQTSKWSVHRGYLFEVHVLGYPPKTSPIGGLARALATGVSLRGGWGKCRNWA